MTHTQALRPGWTPLTIAMMVLGFVFFWPLGLAMLAYILWGDRIPEFRRNAEAMKSDFRRSFGGCSARKNWNGYASGNAAFDDYRTETLRRLEDEQKEFVEYLERLRRAKDKAEFDQFMAERRRPTIVPDSNPQG